MSMDSPRYGVCGWETPHNSVLEDIEQTARTGGAGLGLWEGKFADGQDAEIMQALASHGLQASLVVPRLHTFLYGPISPPDSPRDPKERLRRICESVKRLAEFDPVAIVVGPGTSGDAEHPNGPIEVIAEGLATVAETAQQCGARVAFEALATRHGAPLGRLAEIVPFIDTVGYDNVGVMFDVFHSWDEPNLHHQIRRYVDRIEGVHVNDVQWHERSPFDRTFPGDGRGLCTGILATLIESGYSGWYESEIFSDDGRFGNAFPDSLWALPHEGFLERARETFERCYREALRVVAARQ
jgi:sugar phosphate isomerase/epimerase